MDKEVGEKEASALAAVPESARRSVPDKLDSTAKASEQDNSKSFLKEKDDNDVTAVAVPYRRLYNPDKWDRIAITVGTIGAVANAPVLPGFVAFFGEVRSYPAQRPAHIPLWTRCRARRAVRFLRVLNLGFEHTNAQTFHYTLF